MKYPGEGAGHLRKRGLEIGTEHSHGKAAGERVLQTADQQDVQQHSQPEDDTDDHHRAGQQREQPYTMLGEADIDQRFIDQGIQHREHAVQEKAPQGDAQAEQPVIRDGMDQSAHWNSSLSVSSSGRTPSCPTARPFRSRS